MNETDDRAPTERFSEEANPPKQRTTAPLSVQDERALDPGDVTAGINQSPDEMDIDPTRLFQQSIEQTRMAMVVTDPHQRDNPIVFVNQAFEAMTGYDRSEIVGRNCRFLQGRDTDARAIDRVRHLLETQTVGVVELLNYRKDGTTFWNSLHIGPIYDAEGRLTHFFGSQWDVSEQVAARERETLSRMVRQELEHRTANLFGVIASLIRHTARGETDVDELTAKLVDRVEALSRAHRVSMGGEYGDLAVDLHAMAEAIMRPYRSTEPWRFELSGPVLPIAGDMITPLGVTLHELATNAIKYGSLSSEAGRVSIEWRVEEDVLHLTWTEGDGPILNPRTDGRTQGAGSRLVNDILRGLGGRIDKHWLAEGLRVQITLPLDDDKR